MQVLLTAHVVQLNNKRIIKILVKREHNVLNCRLWLIMLLPYNAELYPFPASVIKIHVDHVSRRIQ